MNLFPYPELKPQSDDAEWLRRNKNIVQALQRFVLGTVDIEPGSVGAGAAVAVTVSTDGIAEGMAIALNPPAGFPSGLDFVVRGADNQLVVEFRNRTGSPIVGDEGTWSYLAVRT